MSYLYGNTGKLNLVKWIETAWNWMSSFRIHATHPLNPIHLGYYGHPEKISYKYNSLYMDHIGLDSTECSNRMLTAVKSVEERRSICDSVCKSDIMKKCIGYKGDTNLLKKMEFENTIKENIHSLKIVNKWKNPQIGNIEHTETWINDYNEDSSLEEDMLQWVNNHNT